MGDAATTVPAGQADGARMWFSRNIPRRAGKTKPRDAPPPSAAASTRGAPPAAIQTASQVASYTYDGLNRRVVRAITNSADLDCTCHDYYHGWSAIETRNGSEQVIKQQVWGTQYIDELCQIAVNDDPIDDTEGSGSQCLCETTYYALTGSTYNIDGLVDSTGELVERYEYTPYGQRLAFKAVASNDRFLNSPLLMSQRVAVEIATGVYDNVALCEFGHQGLMHDEATPGLIQNRARMRNSRYGWLQREPGEYIAGMSLYQYSLSRSTVMVDPDGWSPYRPTQDAADKLKIWAEYLSKGYGHGEGTELKPFYPRQYLRWVHDLFSKMLEDKEASLNANNESDIPWTCYEVGRGGWDEVLSSTTRRILKDVTRSSPYDRPNPPDANIWDAASNIMLMSKAWRLTYDIERIAEKTPIRYYNCKRECGNFVSYLWPSFLQWRPSVSKWVYEGSVETEEEIDSEGRVVTGAPDDRGM